MSYQTREELVAELAVVRTAITNIIASQVQQYGVAGGKSFSHIGLSTLREQERIIMSRLQVIDMGGAAMLTVVPVRTRRGQGGC
jgi:hypothetical protein